MKEKKLTETVRVDKAVNMEKVRAAIWEIVRENKRAPTNTEIQKKTGFSLTTIKKHLKEINFQPNQSPLRALTPDVIMSIAKSAMKGSAASQKLWLQVMEGWSETINANIEQKTLSINVDIKTRELRERLEELEQLQ